jgi:hypothetical protein
MGGGITNTGYEQESIVKYWMIINKVLVFFFLYLIYQWFRCKMSNIFLGKSWSLNESKEKYFWENKLNLKMNFLKKI